MIPVIEFDTSPDTALKVEVLDELGPGGAHHAYNIIGFDASKNPSALDEDGDSITPDPGNLAIIFQNGPIKEVGINGVTHEALLAVLIHRLQSFQAGPYANSYNLEAVSHCQEALKSLMARTAEREARGVEGTNTV